MERWGSLLLLICLKLRHTIEVTEIFIKVFKDLPKDRNLGKVTGLKTDKF